MGIAVVLVHEDESLDPQQNIWFSPILRRMITILKPFCAKREMKRDGVHDIVCTCAVYGDVIY